MGCILNLSYASVVSTYLNYGPMVDHLKTRLTTSLSLLPLSFTPHLLVPSHSDISIYELFTGRTVSKLKGHYSSVTCIDVNTNDIEVYTGSTDNTVLVWTPLNNEVSIY